MCGPLITRRLLVPTLLFALLLVSAGCRSSHSPHLAAVAGFDAGDPTRAMQELEEASGDRRAETEIIGLDTSVAALMNGEPGKAEELLRVTRRQIEFLAQKDLKEQTAAVLSDDQAIAWAGREFERRMVDNLLVLANLMNNGQDAFAYASQAVEVAHADWKSLSPDSTPIAPVTNQSPIVNVSGSQNGVAGTVDPERRPPPRFAPNALANYLYAAVQSQTPTAADVTDRAIRKIGYWKLATDGTPEDVPLTAFGNHTQRGHGVLHVFTFVGRVTPWDEDRAAPTSAALLIADRILSATGKHSLPPTVAPVKIAKPRDRHSSQAWRTVVTVDSGEPRWSQILLDLNQSAWDSYEADRDQQLARAVARRIVKKSAVYAAKDQLAVSKSTGIDLVINLGGIVWEAMEKPDTRHWNLLPERIEVTQAELPVGEHAIRLTRSDSKVSNHGVTFPVTIDDGRNTFVICFRPSEDFAGRILVGGTEQLTFPARAPAATN